MDPDIQAQIDAARRGAGVTGPTTNAPASSDAPTRYVYTGGTPRSRYEGKEMAGGDNLHTYDDGVRSVDEAYDSWHTMSAKEQKAFATKLERMGVIKPGEYTYGDLAALWREAVDQSSDIFMATKGQKKVTPTQYLGLMGSITGQDGPAGPQATNETSTNTSTNTSSSTNSQVNYSTKAAARANITDAFRAELGRDPSRREVRAFYRALHTQERKHPSVQTQHGTNTQTDRSKSHTNAAGDKHTSTSSSNSKSSSSGVTRGGVGPEFAQNYIDDTYDAEQDDRNAAGPWYDALLGLAGGGS